MTAPQLSASNANTEFYQERLPNGLQIVGQRMPDLESVSVCFFARTGARDEHDPAIYGVSHFLEHMVFKGTASRDAEQITLAFNRMGAEFNAFTSVEQTVYYARVLRPVSAQRGGPAQRHDAPAAGRRRLHTGAQRHSGRDRALGGCADEPGLPPHDADILRRASRWATMCWARVRASATLRGGADARLPRRRYAANNLILALAGNFEWDEVRALAEEKCGAWTRGEEGRTAEPFTPTAAPPSSSSRQQKQQIMSAGEAGLGEQDDDLYADASGVDGAGRRHRLAPFLEHLSEGAGRDGCRLALAAGQHGAVAVDGQHDARHAPAVLELVRAELRVCRRTACMRTSCAAPRISWSAARCWTAIRHSAACRIWPTPGWQRRKCARFRTSCARIEAVTAGGCAPRAGSLPRDRAPRADNLRSA